MSSTNADIQSIFEGVGGNFLSSPEDLIKRIRRLKSFIFDWDGVFNNGVKLDGNGSPFSEVDSMGLNMLRFSYYLKFNFIPAIYIITGENNLPAIQLGKREHFSTIYLKAKAKTDALSHIKQDSEISKAEIAFVYDDILDLGLAKETEVRFFVNRRSSPLLNKYVEENKLADYRTGAISSLNPVREISELCIGAIGNYDEVVNLRIANSEVYKQYLKLRNQKKMHVYRYEEDKIRDISDL